MADPQSSRPIRSDLLAAAAYSRAAGTRDLSPEAAARRDRIETRLLERFSAYGFSRVDVPTLEYRDLYSPARIGPDLFHHLVLARLPSSAAFPPDDPPGTLDDTGPGLTTHDAALRPDFTAPLARMLVNRLRSGDGIRRELPARWSYAGSVFRARTPRPLRMLEFRQAGVELLGAAHPMADLEVLTAACDATSNLQVPGWRMHLGHSALFRALVELVSPAAPESRRALANGLVLAARLRTRASLGDQGFARYLHGARQTLTQRVRDHLAEPGETSDSVRVHERLCHAWPELVEPDTLDLAQWRARLPDLNERLLRETWSAYHGLSARRADLLLHLARSAGAPEPFFAAVGQYVEALADGASSELLDRIDSLLGSFHNLTRDLRATVDGPLDLLVTPAASRGIAYYTGITFEIHTSATKSAYSDICGGGRYSDLHRWLYDRAGQTDAFRSGTVWERPTLSRELADSLTGVGFAFGVERIDAALHHLEPLRPRPDVYVVVQDAAFARAAFQSASRLRAAGLSVTCELPTSRYTVRDLATQLGAAAHAGGRGAHHALIFGIDEHREGKVGLKNLDTRAQTTLSLTDAETRLVASRAHGTPA
jgi:histidyl-tRNA synthetase